MKIIIVGAGEVGFHIAGRLAAENKDVVVIDPKPEALRRVLDQLDVQVLEGSGSSPAVLEEAGVKSAEILLAVTDSDEINLTSCLFADILSPATRKLARIRDMDYSELAQSLQKERPHIDAVINPDKEMVRTIDRLLSVPGALDVAEFADGRVKLAGIRVEPLSPLAGVRLSNIARVAGTRKILVAAIVRGEELIIPTGRDTILAGDVVYLAEEADQLIEAISVFGITREKVRRAMIVGGGRSGMALAELLVSKGVHTKIIEKNPAKAAKIAACLEHVVVLNGDGSDHQLLSEENVADMDVVITLSSDEETNILTALVAKRMGAKAAITRIDKFGYLSMMPALGLDLVVSARLSAINTILHLVRRGMVLSSIALKGERAEVLEAVAMETSDLVGRPIKDLDFPRGAIIITILRNGQVIIPSGDSVIEPGDHIIILSNRKAVPKVEKALAVKLEFF
ncbi:MAG: Trk system potassium transporter TrkA [Desulfatibacillaceae bacterium]|nr:Trk system potassium transporter TrkA [Desulfatibacillaceae bacterium]